jgi:two-component system phosphate regulon sensor histidine kinase PhoR
LKNASPKTVALYISLSATVSFILIALFINRLSINLNIKFFLGSCLVFIASFIISYQLIEEFIYRKIKIIYKNILKTRLNKGSGKERKLEADVLQQVNDDVLEWTKEQEKELSKLQSLEKYRREFIGNVSHELKTPIFNIQGYLLTLLEGGLEDENVNRKFLLKAQNSVERMITLVEDLDIISKIETGEMQLKLSNFEIVSLVKEVIDQLEEFAKQRNIQLIIQVETEQSYKVNADKERIRQVITNLMVNAIKYGVEGGYTKVKIFDMHDHYLVEVVDNGVGIEEQHIPRLFERFYRTDAARNRDQGGSGLGLAIVKHIIEAHQQTINARSLLGKGSVFSFTLKKAKFS